MFQLLLKFTGASCFCRTGCKLLGQSLSFSRLLLECLASFVQLVAHACGFFELRPQRVDLFVELLGFLLGLCLLGFKLVPDAVQLLPLSLERLGLFVGLCLLFFKLLDARFQVGFGAVEFGVLLVEFTAEVVVGLFTLF